MVEIFGQHQNANVIYLTKENHILCETLSNLQILNESLKNNNKENKVLIQLSQISRNIPTLINSGNIVDNIKKKRHILDFVLLKEVPINSF